MKKTLLTSIIAIMLTIPVYADIASDATNASCDGATLSGATNGSVNLSADWTENTINLTWYNDRVENNGTAMNVDANSAQCVYDHGITLPNQPIKQGYTFAGWRVRQCSLSEYYIASMDNEKPEWSAQYVRWKPISQNGYTMVNDGLTDHSGDLEAGEWCVTLSAGEIHSRAICSGLYGDNYGYSWHSGVADWTATESELVSASGEQKYCWCAVTSFDNSCSVASPLWVYANIGTNSRNCMDGCAYFCTSYFAGYIHNNFNVFRRALFGMPTR